MSTLREEIALEQHAIEELDAESAKLWNAGHYGLARIASREAQEARERLKQLEQQFVDEHIVVVHVTGEQ